LKRGGVEEGGRRAGGGEGGWRRVRGICGRKENENEKEEEEGGGGERKDKGQMLPTLERFGPGSSIPLCFLRLSLITPPKV
jgi:hypothetical protein